MKKLAIYLTLGRRPRLPFGFGGRSPVAGLPWLESQSWSSCGDPSISSRTQSGASSTSSGIQVMSTGLIPLRQLFHSVTHLPRLRTR